MFLRCRVASFLWRKAPRRISCSVRELEANWVKPPRPVPFGSLYGARKLAVALDRIQCTGGLMTADTQRIIDLDLKLWNTGNAELAKQLYSEDAERTDPNGREPIHHHGVHQISKFVTEVRTAFPDFKLEMKQV